MKVKPSIDPSAFAKQSSSAAKIRFLLQYAHLAPSTHNVQPWLFEVGPTSCRIFFNPALKLPQADALDRDLYISLGCCLENLIQAARYFGVYEDLRIHLKGELVAEVFFNNLDQTPAPTAENSALLQAILDRFNARGIFRSQAVPSSFLSKLDVLNNEYGPDVKVHAVTGPSKVKQLAELTAAGLREAYHSRAFRAEIAGLIRHNLSRKRDGIPGYSLRLNTPMSFVMPTLMHQLDIGKKLGGLNSASLGSAPLVCVYTAPSNTPATFLQVGRLAERVMLEANVTGMKTSIFVAAIEIGDLHKQVQEVLGTAEIPQFLMAVGYIDTPQGHTPRNRLESRIKS